MTDDHVGTRFDRLPMTADERAVPERPTSTAVRAFFRDRFGIPPDRFDGYTFWERGKGKVWAFRGNYSTPLEVEALGIHLLRTRHRSWKPTTDGVQLFGRAASRNVLELADPEARRFWRGEAIDREWDGDPGYVIVARRSVGRREPLGVGLYTDGTLESMVPKGRREDVLQP